MSFTLDQIILLIADRSRWQRWSSIPSSPIFIRASATQGCSCQRPRQTDPMQRQKRQKRQRRNVGPHSHNRPGKSQHFSWNHPKKKYLPHQLTFYHSCPFISFTTKDGFWERMKAKAKTYSIAFRKKPLIKTVHRPIPPFYIVWNRTWSQTAKNTVVKNPIKNIFKVLACKITLNTHVTRKLTKIGTKKKYIYISWVRGLES